MLLLFTFKDVAKYCIMPKPNRKSDSSFQRKMTNFQRKMKNGASSAEIHYQPSAEITRMDSSRV